MTTSFKKSQAMKIRHLEKKVERLEAERGIPSQRRELNKIIQWFAMVEDDLEHYQREAFIEIITGRVFDIKK